MGAAPVRILIVEDEPAHAEAIRRALEGAATRIEVRVVNSLQEYRREVSDSPPDLALVDLNLPDGNAIEVLTLPPEAGPFPILVMTSYGTEQIAVKALKAGALDYVVKSPEAFTAMPRTVARARREWQLLQDRQQAQEALRDEQEWRYLNAWGDSRPKPISGWITEGSVWLCGPGRLPDRRRIPEHRRTELVKSFLVCPRLIREFVERRIKEVLAGDREGSRKQK